MYEYFEGTLERRAPTSLVLDVGGVGYSLCVPLGTPGEVGQAMRIWVHLVVREDAHTLYGFASIEQRQLFRMLLSVRGVGPSLALGMLSSIDAARLTDAILTENKSVLTGIKGVGAKTANQILLDLSERVARLASATPFTDSQSPAAPDSRDLQLQDAISALVSIGYKEKDASKLVDKAAAKLETIDVEELIRAALHG